MRVAAVQTGGMPLALDDALARLLPLVREAGARADLVVLPEMITGPYFAVAEHDPALRELAAPVPGPVSEAMAAAAVEADAAILVGTYELAADGRRFNSVVHVDRTGALVRGRLPDGTTAAAYRKRAVADVDMPGFAMDEQAYCDFGPGPMRFDVDGTAVGTLICYDRAFSEAWQQTAALDVDVVAVAVSSFGWREELFVHDLRLRAMEFGVFVVAANRSGPETVAGATTDYFGRSCIIAPDGTVLAEAGAHTRDEIVVAELDPALLGPARAAWVVEDRATFGFTA